MVDSLELVSGYARLLIDSWRLAVSESAGTWPGFDLAAIPVVLVSVNQESNLEAAVAFNHPKPEVLGSLYCVLEIGGYRIAVTDKVSDPEKLVSMAPFDFFADIGGTNTFVLVGCSGELGMEPGTPEFVALLIHEAFHRYQFEEWVPDSLPQDIDGYDFSVENLELVLLENRILIAAYQADTLAETERLARQFAAVRSARRGRDSRVALDGRQERIEGSARYVEHRIGDAIGNIYTSTNHTIELVQNDASLDRPSTLEGGIKSFFGFSRFYSSGATILALLDRLDPRGIKVAERLQDGDTPAQVLKQHLEPLGDIDHLVTAARAEHDPNIQLGPAAATLARLATTEESVDFGIDDVPGDATTGVIEITDDQVACLQEHGLDLTTDNFTIPDHVARACFDKPGP